MATQKQTPSSSSSLYKFALPSIAQIIPAIYSAFIFRSSSHFLFLITNVLTVILGGIIFSKLNSSLKRDALNNISIFTVGVLSIVLIVGWVIMMMATKLGLFPIIGGLLAIYSGLVVNFLISGSLLTWIWLFAVLIPLVRLLLLGGATRKNLTKKDKTVKALLIFSELTYIATPFIVYFGTQLIISMNCIGHMRDFCGFQLIIPSIIILSLCSIAVGTGLLIIALTLRKKHSK